MKNKSSKNVSATDLDDQAHVGVDSSDIESTGSGTPTFRDSGSPATGTGQFSMYQLPKDGYVSDLEKHKLDEGLL